MYFAFLAYFDVFFGGPLSCLGCVSYFAYFVGVRVVLQEDLFLDSLLFNICFVFEKKMKNSNKTN